MNLTEDAVWEILVRLPVRSLLRFRCVSKDWCALIESSLFKDRYLALRRARAGVDEFIVVNHTLGFGSNWRDGKNFVTCCYGDYESIALSVSAASTINFEISLSDSGNHSPPLIFVNHVNGIVCLADFNPVGRLGVTLLNPSLREFRKLPYLGFECFPTLGIGFGFDDATNDYKVIAIITTSCENILKDIAVVYHLSTDSWKILDDMPAFVVSIPELCWLVCCGCIFSHGSIHWCVGWHGHNQQIITFNMTNELFQEIHFPPGWKDYDYTLSGLFTVDESTIALVALNHQVLDVWVMKEYGVRESWTKQYSIRSLPSIAMPLCYWRKDKLLLQTVSKELICLLKGQVYQPEQCSPICLLSDPNTRSLELLSCIESFVSIKRV